MRLIVLFAALLVLPTAIVAAVRNDSIPLRVADGDPASVHPAGTDIPFSNLASPEARQALVALHKASPEPDSRTDIEGLRRFHSAATDKLLGKMREIYAVSITPRKIAGINTQVVIPQAGVAKNNRGRVLINLHGGAFTFGSGNGGLVESVPIAATERIEVIAVDYRLAPENKFPAATEDVAAVYGELLKSHRPEDIGIYGCSAGGILAAESVAWFSNRGLPTPGAIATLCATGAEIDGDSAFLAPLLFGTPIPAGGHPLLLTSLPYFQGVDPRDPLAFPIVSPQLLAKFPPTLLIAGNRDFSASSLTLMHRRLRAVGVDAELYLFDGLWHAFIVDCSLPESREVYGIVARFFDSHLGRRAKRVAQGTM
jgi:monoterpene epsilon-lactone hydrolase